MGVLIGGFAGVLAGAFLLKSDIILGMFVGGHFR